MLLLLLQVYSAAAAGAAADAMHWTQAPRSLSQRVLLPLQPACVQPTAAAAAVITPVLLLLLLLLAPPPTARTLISSHVSLSSLKRLSRADLSTTRLSSSLSLSLSEPARNLGRKVAGRGGGCRSSGGTNTGRRR